MGRRLRPALVSAKLAGWTGLNVEVDGTRIIVTMPGASFWVTYQKKSGNQHLVLIGSWVDPNVTSPEAEAFRTRALNTATDKARQLGWIA